MGIELKTKSDRSLQTLFSRVPSRYCYDGGKAEFFSRYRYFDMKRDRWALSTSFTSIPDSLGFSLKTKHDLVQVRQDGTVVLEYRAELLEEALLSKHMQTAFIKLNRVRHKGAEACTVDEAIFCKWPSIIRFLRLINERKVFLDLTMSKEKNRRIRDHGFLWRIKPEASGRPLPFDSPGRVVGN